MCVDLGQMDLREQSNVTLIHPAGIYQRVLPKNAGQLSGSESGCGPGVAPVFRIAAQILSRTHGMEVSSVVFTWTRNHRNARRKIEQRRGD